MDTAIDLVKNISKPFDTLPSVDEQYVRSEWDKATGMESPPEEGESTVDAVITIAKVVFGILGWLASRNKD